MIDLTAFKNLMSESELDVYSRIPPIPQGFHCLELVLIKKKGAELC